VNLAYPVVLLAILRTRIRAGVAIDRERAVAIGCAALAVVFLLSLPFVAARLALAVQLQVSRVFWMLDVFTTAYVLWWIAERPGRPRVVAPVLCAVAVGLALVRGIYVVYVERTDRSAVELRLPESEWDTAMGWLRGTAPDAHVLADPGHAWKFGTSVRVSGERDVFLEEVKDSALAMYARDVALRVRERTAAAGDFSTLTAERARALAGQYDLDYLVTERPLDLPVAYRNARFTIHSLR
jgi:hypothetical protein